MRDEIFALIKQEYALSVAMVLKVTGQDALLGRFPKHRRRLAQRLPFLNQVSRQQIELIRRFRAAAGEGPRRSEDFVPLLLNLDQLHGQRAGLDGLKRLGQNDRLCRPLLFVKSTSRQVNTSSAQPC